MQVYEDDFDDEEDDVDGDEEETGSDKVNPVNVL